MQHLYAPAILLLFVMKHLLPYTHPSVKYFAVVNHILFTMEII